MKYPLANTDIGAQEMHYVNDAIKANWISGSGPYVDQFAGKLKAHCGRDFTLPVANGTLALELALRALGVDSMHRVIVPALTFVAPAAVASALGAEVIFVDINPDDWTLDIDQVTDICINETIYSIIAVDVLGHPCDYDTLEDLAMQNEVVLIEDAAEAFGSTYKGRPVGSFGHISTFSFHANKTLTTGEGGAVLTNEEFTYQDMQLIANHGMKSSKPYYHSVYGTNHRMTNLTAAIGYGQMERRHALIQRRKEIDRLYDRLLPKGLGRRPVMADVMYVPWLATYTIDPELRDSLVAEIRANGVDARAIWPMLPSLPLYAPVRKVPVPEFPVADRISRSAFWLPTSSTMSDADVYRVAEIVSGAYAKIC